MKVWDVKRAATTGIVERDVEPTSNAWMVQYKTGQLRVYLERGEWAPTELEACRMVIAVIDRKLKSLERAAAKARALHARIQARLVSLETSDK